MSTTFIVTLIIAVIVLGNLRLFLLIACAVILALIVTGVGTLSGAVGGGTDTTVLAPAPPGSEPDNPDVQSDNLPQAQPEPSR